VKEEKCNRKTRSKPVFCKGWRIIQCSYRLRRCLREKQEKNSRDLPRGVSDSRYVTASNFKDEKQISAIFLHVASEYIQSIFETLSDTGDTYPKAKEKLIAYF